MLTCPSCSAPNDASDDFCGDCGERLTTTASAIDRYSLEGVLGRGASSVVYRATDVATAAPVAVKALNPELLAQPGMRQRLREEAASLRQLSHDNVVKVVDYVESDEAVWLVTEAVEGASLRTVLVHAHQLEPEQALAIFEGMLSGLAHAHGRGIVHGDLKPENVLVEASGTAKLVDFGQAVRAGQATTGGTAAYMSPEAVRGEALSPASDLYSVGAVLYEALTGRPPFLAAHEDALLQLQLTEVPPPIVGLSAAIASLVEALLAKDPALRPQSAGSALGAFEAAVRDAYGSEWRRRAGVAGLVTASATRFPTLTKAAQAAPWPQPAVGDPGSQALRAAPAASGAGAGAAGDIRARSAVALIAMRWVIGLEALWLLTLAAGVCFFAQLYSLNTSSAVGTAETTHSLLPPELMIATGLVGFLATFGAAKIWAARQFGLGLVALRRLQRPRGFVRRHEALTVAVVIVLAAAVTAYATNVDGLTNRLDGVGPSYVELFPAGATASSSVADHPPADAIDNDTTTFWGTSAGQPPGVEQTITLGYSSPQQMAAFAIISGDQATATSFGKSAHPEQIELLFSEGPPLYFTLADSPTFQNFLIAQRASTFFELKILSVYPGAAPCAISDLFVYGETG